MKSTPWIARIACALVSLVLTPMRIQADVLFTQPPTTAGTLLMSAYWDPDGSDFDEYVWDAFMLPTAGNVTEVQWRGGGGTPVNEFEISIYASIPAGSQPDVVNPPLRHYMSGNNCGQTYAGTFGGVAMYDYHFTLPTAFLAAANTRYWIQIEAWTAGPPAWGLATGSGGNGSHFHRGLAVTGDFRFYFASGDAAFTLIGTPAVCNAPTITVNPQPVSGCSGAMTAVFNAAATGSGTFTYQWRLNSNPVYDGPNGGGHGGGAFISGATTPTLTIQSPSYWADVGVYDCVISNSCGPSTTTGAQLTVALGGPSVTTGPTPPISCRGGTVNVSVTATNAPTAYIWRRNTVAVSNGVTPAGSVISGANTASLTISNLQPADTGTFTCSVTNPCLTVTSSPLVVSICRADFNCDTTISSQDFFDFISAFFSLLPSADFNSDHTVNSQDFFDFVGAFFAGC